MPATHMTVSAYRLNNRPAAVLVALLASALTGCGAEVAGGAVATLQANQAKQAQAQQAQVLDALKAAQDAGAARAASANE